MYWHPSCSDAVMRSIPTDKFREKANNVVGMDMIRSTVTILGSGAWDKFQQYVIKVRKDATPSSQHPEAYQSGSHDLQDVSMTLGCSLGHIKIRI